MEMHSPQSLYDIHGLSTRAPVRPRLRWIRRATAVLLRLKFALTAEMRARRAAAELAKLDDRLLRDIGISRGDIERAVRTRRSDPRREER